MRPNRRWKQRWFRPFPSGSPRKGSSVVNLEPVIRGFLVGVVLATIAGCGPPPTRKAPALARIALEAPGALAWPAAPARARIKFIMALTSPEEMGFSKSWTQRAVEWLAGPKRHRFVRPFGITAQDDVALVMTDPGSASVHVFDFQRQQYRNLTLEREGGFRSPVGVALGDGRLYVSDSDRGVVFVLTLKGKLLRVIGGDGELGRPAGLALHPRNGHLYVADVVAHRVVVYDGEGKMRSAFGSRGVGPGEFNYPTHVFISEAEEVYVTDSMNFRVQAFGPDGSFRFTVGRVGDSAGNFSKPKGVAVDSDGHIYVVDAMFDTVQILDRDGTPLLAFGSSGKDVGEFWLPSGLWIDGRDRIYVADSFNQRVQVFQYVR